MKPRARFIAINGRELRSLRLARGWTQSRLAKTAGYSERLVRKAEKGGTLEIETIQNLAEALSSPDSPVKFESLTMDIKSIARKWVEAWDRHEVAMLSEIQEFLAEDFEFVCPGDPGAAPFIGTFKGASGLQQWLDAYFSTVQRQKNTDVEYYVGDNSVMARWLELGTFMGSPAPPIRINMHFQFVDGLIVRMVDDYDTRTGSVVLAHARSRPIPESA